MVSFFGCANYQIGHFRRSVTGIMGLSRSPLSIIGQMGATAKRFSYCLPPISSPIKTTFLRFGNDVKGRNLSKVSFLNSIDYNYRVNLLDISISGQRLNLPTGTFPTGCMLDAGCGGSVIETRAYNEILRVLLQHFQRFNLTRVSGGLGFLQGELCYRLRRGFRNYPGMTFHFQGANYEIGPENLFRVTSDRFCLALTGSNDRTILGAFQQQNVRFIYDNGYQKLFFSKEDCSQDGA
ncbi:hypothetical protein DH2020_011688 [Rehmannia glutinosa]|uniref:Peptidase A1 domain-containing protein n=1 Tax=Rehmannia glutinosa TaxID=99300 RepID=A0ABR0XE05_REHGL